MASNPKESASKTQKIYTVALNSEQLGLTQAYCAKQGWEAYAVEHALFAFKGKVFGVNVVGYKSGKLVIQGKGTEDFVSFVLEPEITKEARLGYDEARHPEWFEAHAGLDESGKGDFFGPLVSACVIADKAMVKKWIEVGIKDSKRVTSDAEMFRFEKIIRETPGVVVKTAFANMAKYNELYVKFKSNLNLLLAWFHAKCLQEALKERQVPWGMLDQFSKEPLVQSYFKNTDFDLRMQTKAESDPVVAAASIVARAEYVRQMERLSEKAGMKLQKGASSAVKEQGQKLIDKYGKDELGNFVKMHFKTAYEVLGLPVPKKNYSYK